ncbi:hypothetical protein M0R45_018652 [Rubus argutus]|uniref:Uncharacterized protein n=1 Tax=Rubus argutus TaxID=59490 RepID=A0AAW1X5K2_RUBAR
MSFVKLTENLSKSFPPKTIHDQLGAVTSRGTRMLVTSATRPLQSKKEDDAAEKTKEAADAVKDGAREVRRTCEFMRDTVETTAKTRKYRKTAETITDKTKGTVSGAWGVAKNTTEIIKDKVMGK